MRCKYCGHFKTHKRGKTKRGHDRYQRYFCDRCQKSFSELTGTIYQNRHLTPNNIDLILKYEGQGMSFNEVAKQVGVCPKTVSNLIEICQKNSSKLPNEINLIKIESGDGYDEITGKIIHIIVIRD